MRFLDREDAGQKLSRALEKYRHDNPVVLALPRGGVVLGAIVAKHLNAPLDLSIPRKIGHPTNPEFAVCAVSESGELLCHDAAATIDVEWIKHAVHKETREARRRRAAYLGNRAPLRLAGKTTILVDDGIATGLTIKVAIQELKKRRPAKIVVAVPVSPADVADAIATDVDDMIVLEKDPAFLGAVGAYYDDFSQVTDEEVIALLSSTNNGIV